MSGVDMVEVAAASRPLIARSRAGSATLECGAGPGHRISIVPNGTESTDGNPRATGIRAHE